VTNKTGAVHALGEDRKCVTVHLKSITPEKDGASAVARGLRRKLTNFKIVYILHFLLDYPGTLKQLTFISEGTTYSEYY
jgi:hypothetical protein